jgi:hypothetical protein
MTLETIFAHILRIYPRAFRERFGAELRALLEVTKPSERKRFFTDLFVGALGERLQAWHWIRFIAVLGWMGALSIGTMYVFWNEIALPHMLHAFDVLVGLADVGLLFLPFALISRLQRPPHFLEWLPMIVLSCALTFLLVLFPAREVVVVTQFQWFVGNVVTPIALGCYGISQLRSSSTWLKLLKISLLGLALLTLSWSWLGPNEIIAGIAPHQIWGALRVVLSLGVVLGLLLGFQRPRTSVTP